MHIARSDDHQNPTVHGWTISYDVESKIWLDRILSIPEHTGVIERLGSGASTAKYHEQKWSDKAFSREIFSSFCDAIHSGTDGLSGGAPQLAGFYSKKPARSFGVLYEDEAFFCGIPVVTPSANTKIEWRDRLFQRIDISTRNLLKGAQIHARPKGI